MATMTRICCSRIRAITLLLPMAMVLLAFSGLPVTAESPSSTEAADSTVLVSGRLLSSTGVPIAGHVEALAWPDELTMSLLETGGDVKLTPIASADTGPNGAFVLRLAEDAPLGPILDLGPDHPVINFTLIGTSGSQLAHFAAYRRYELKLPETSLPITPADLWPLDPAPVVDLQMGLGNSVEITNIESLMEEPSTPTAEPEEPIDLPPLVEKSCTIKLVQKYDPSWDWIGDTFTSQHTTGRLTYLSGSSSSLGVGVSASGNYGTFSASGTHSFSKTGKVTFPTTSSNLDRGRHTKFELGKFRMFCYSNGYSSTMYEARTISFVGGTGWTAPPRPNATKCAPWSKGSEFETTTATAVRYTYGLGAKAAIGINLSSRTGYNSKTKLLYKIDGPSYVCGTNDYPYKAQRVITKNR